MSQIFSKPNAVRLPRPKKVEKNEEYGRESGIVLMCAQCKNTHFKKKWHHAGEIPGPKRFVKKAICPACLMIKNKTYEGELIIENIPARQGKEILNLVRTYGNRALERDPQDRIIKTEKIKNGYRVTMTENQTAVRLAKKIRDVFRTVKLDISHAAEPAEVSRVRAIFLRGLEKSIDNLQNS